MRSLSLLLAAAAVGLTATAAPANAHRGLRMFRPAPMPTRTARSLQAEFAAARNARFAAIDTNKDSALEVSEMRAWKRTWPSRVRDARFKALDGDGDGKIVPEEFVAQRKAKPSTGIDARQGRCGQQGGIRCGFRKNSAAAWARSTGTAAANTANIPGAGATVGAAGRKSVWT